MAVVLQVGTVTVIAVGATPVLVFPANISGGYITNPFTESDQGITPVEDLFIDPVSNSANLLARNAFGTTFRITPGATWAAVPGQNTATWANATTSGHRFTAVYWL